jgi:ribosomal protein L10
MPNLINRLIVRELSQDFESAEGMVIVSLDGLSVEETEGLRGGLLEGNLLDAGEAQALAELPGRDELRARLLRAIAGPAQKLVGLLHAPHGALARVIQAHADAGSGPGPDTEEPAEEPA